MKYGNLIGGQLLCVPAALIKRCKQHFLDLPCGVSIILGNNGFIWLSRSLTEDERKEKEVRDKDEDMSKLSRVCRHRFLFDEVCNVGAAGRT